LVLEALSSQDLWASIASNTSLGACPPTVGGSNDQGWGRETYELSSSVSGATGNPFEERAALTFDTTVLPVSVTTQLVRLRVTHVSVEGDSLPVELWGGSQPLFGPSIEAAEFDAGTELMSTESMSDIVSNGEASFGIGGPLINKGGLTQFVMRLNDSCPYDDTRWKYHTPESTTSPPILTVHYLP